MLKVTLKKSPIGYSFQHKRTVEALGLRGLNHSVTVPDNQAMRGMLRKVRFLVEVCVVEDGEEGRKDATS